MNDDLETGKKTGEGEQDPETFVAPETGYSIPPKEKRFSVSKEQFSKDRLKRLREGFNLLQSERPELAGISLYGSMTKGNALEESDIDGDIFIDTELVQDGDQIFERTEKNEEYGQGFQYELKEDIAKTYSTFIKDYLKEKSELQGDQVKHLRTYPINRQIIDDQIKGLIDYKHQVTERDNKRDQIDEYYTRGEDPPDELKSNEDPKLFYVAGNVSSLFHLQMGKGLDKYRSYLIDKLKEAGDEGEQVWQQIIQSTSFMEDYGKNGYRNIDLPQTLEQASKIYQKIQKQ